MSMLDRYRKPGGFYQLVSLVETCPPAKKEKFLELIKAEDEAWAEAVKEKMLDVDRIFSWNDETLAEIFGTLQDLTVAVILHGTNDDLKNRIFTYMTQARKRKIEDLMGSQSPTPTEIASMQVKLIETVRKMAHDGYIRFEKVDPQLHFDNKIEEQLTKPKTTDISALLKNSDFTIEYENESGNSGKESGSQAASSADAEARLAEILSLKKKLAELSKENAVLRHELSIAKNKLEQIKKIA